MDKFVLNRYSILSINDNRHMAGWIVARACGYPEDILLAVLNCSFTYTTIFVFMIVRNLRCNLRCCFCCLSLIIDAMLETVKSDGRTGNRVLSQAIGTPRQMVSDLEASTNHGATRNGSLTHFEQLL